MYYSVSSPDLLRFYCRLNLPFVINSLALNVASTGSVLVHRLTRADKKDQTMHNRLLNKERTMVIPL